jgi:Protein of unknown function (DUF3405)
MSAKEAVLYRTHVLNPMIRREIARLGTEVIDCSHWVVGYVMDNAAVPGPAEQNHRMYRRNDLATLPYPSKVGAANWAKPEGNNDLPVLAFYREQPDYDFYWVIEYDVRYTGHWGRFFEELRSSDADFLSTTMQGYRENPRWWWWGTLVNTPAGPLRRVRCFTPFCRLSNRALSTIDQWYRDGGAGHYELVWPSVCRTAGLRVEDIGGWGRYTPERWRGKHYANTPVKANLSPGTFVFRPPFKDELLAAEVSKYGGEPMLWHPIKD